MIPADTLSLDPSELTQQELHGHLLSAVAPRPICFASTVDAEGTVNLSPFSYFNVFSSNPPVLIFSPARSGRDNSLKHSHENVKEVPEVTINIVNHAIVEQMSLASTAYAKGVDEFVKSGLTPVASDRVRPPRVGEAPVAFECKVDQVIELGETPGAGNLILCRVLRMHIDKGYLDADGRLDTPRMDLVGRMGGSWYVRAQGSALFEIPKPIRGQGIGVDALPEGIRRSPVLTGNNLGRLGNVKALPDETEVAQAGADGSIPETADREALHAMAQERLNNGVPAESVLALLLFAETRT